MGFAPGCTIRRRKKSRQRLLRLKKSLICDYKTSSKPEPYAGKTQHARSRYSAWPTRGEHANRVVGANRQFTEAAQNRADQQRWPHGSTAAGCRRDEGGVVRDDLFCWRLFRWQKFFAAEAALPGSGARPVWHCRP